MSGFHTKANPVTASSKWALVRCHARDCLGDRIDCYCLGFQLLLIFDNPHETLDSDAY